MALSDKNKQLLLVIGILGGAVLVILVYFGMMNIRPKTKELLAETEKFQTELKKNKEDLERFKRVIADVESRNKVIAAFQRVESRLPTRQDPIEVFQILRQYFDGTDVQFTYLEPGRQTNRGRYFEYPFVVRGRARYHEFGQLVNLIECNPNRLMHVNSFKLTNDARRPSIHPMEVGISTFTIRTR
jgi:Tfp pilus assembly protein PilO